MQLERVSKDGQMGSELVSVGTRVIAGTAEVVVEAISLLAKFH